MLSLTTVALLLLMFPLHQSDPASELAEMERIMRGLYPFPVLLNPRVGRHQLAARVARIFDLEYNQAGFSSRCQYAIRHIEMMPSSFIIS